MKFAATLLATSIAAGLAGCATGLTSSAEPVAAAPAVVQQSGHPEAQRPPAAPVEAARLPPAEPDLRAGAAQQAADESLPSVALTPQILYQVLAADIAAQRGEFGAAFGTYMTVARDTRDPRLARRATEVAIGGRAFDQALQAAQLWRELSPDSQPAAQLQETLWLNTGRFAEVEPVLASRLQQARADGTLAVAYAQLQRTLLRSQDRAGAWSMLQRVSAPDLSVPAARLARAASAAAAEDFEAAAAEAREAMRLDSDSEEAVVATARYMQRLPDGTPRALELLDRHLQRSPMATDARMLHARLLLADGRSDEARAQFERLLAQNPESPLVLFSLAQIAHQAKQPAEAERLLVQYVGLPRSVLRDNSVAMLFLAQIAEDAKRIDDALQWLEKVPRGEEFVAASVRRAMLLSRKGRLAEARELLQGTRATGVREQVQLIAGEAALLREAKLNQDSFDVLAKGLARLPDNPELLYDHAMAAERLDRLQDMETSLRRVIALRPDHAHAYNALGYTFADRNIRLDEARELIARALELAPDDAHILDSMGWVLFRQKNYPLALEYLRKAYGLRPEAEIAVHLGEVLWATGNVDEARKVWREARGREPDNTTLRETLARLNVVDL
jgi:tetratricopeptide (TPR) repeat protein